MALVVKPTREAWSLYAQLEPLLQEEIRDHVAKAAENPGSELWQAPIPWPSDRLTLAYDSAVVDGLRIALVFADLDVNAETMTLIAISTAMHPPGGDP